MIPTRVRWMAAALLMLLVMSGCENEDQWKAEFVENYADRQAEQTQEVLKLQSEVAQASKELVAADAQARQELIALERELQGERALVGAQRDKLELERRELASQRRQESLLVAAISTGGCLLLCALPLVLCWLLLCRSNEPAESDPLTVQVLLEEATAQRLPMLPGPAQKKIDKPT